MSNARSHAAKVSHLRKRLPERQPEHRDVTAVGESSKSESRVVALSDDFEGRHPPLFVSPFQHLKYVKSSQLDPFFPLPRELPVRDQSLLHHYFVEMPSTFGTTPASPFCPVRDISGPGISQSEIWLWGIIMSADVQVHGSMGATRQRNWARKVAIYHLLRKLMENPQSRFSDLTISMIIATGQGAMRLGLLTLSQEHWKAATTFIKIRGGDRGFKAIQDFQYPLVHLASKVYVCIGVLDIFGSCAAFDESAGRVLKRLRLLQEWNRAIRDGSGRWRPASLDETLVRMPGTMEDADERVWRSHLALRSSTFNPASALRRYIETVAEETGMAELSSEERSFLGALFSIHSLLLALSANPGEASLFLTELLYLITESERTNTRPRLPGMMVYFVVSYCAWKLGHWKSSDDSTFLLWEVIEFVDIVMLATSKTRDKVIKAMSSWLTCEMDTTVDLIMLEEDIFKSLVSEAHAHRMLLTVC